MRELPVPALELAGDGVPGRLIAPLDQRLHDPARVVLEYDILHSPTHGVHQRGDVYLALGLGDVFLPRERPVRFGVDQHRRVRLSGPALRLQLPLRFVRFPGGCHIYLI